MFVPLLEGATAVGPSSPKATQDANRVVIQVSQVNASSFTVEIKGRLAPNMPWFVLASKTAEDIFEVPAATEIMADLTAIAGVGAAVSVALRTIRD